MGTGLIYEGQIPLAEWKKLYYFIDGVWKPIPVKPNPSPLRLVRESDPGPYCKVCGSSLYWPGIFFFFRFKNKGCLQPECSNYYNRSSNC